MAGWNMQVLVVDDHQESALALSELLRFSGYDVETAYNAADALVLLEQNTPSIAILDLRMPEMSGFALAEKIRESIPARRLRLIALTGTDGQHQEQQALASGFDYFFAKPANWDQLYSYVQKAAASVDRRSTPRR